MTSIQNLDSRFPIVNEDGTPTDYFMRLINDRGNNSQETRDKVEDKADKTTILTAGVGLDGGGDLNANRTFDLNANLNDLSDVDTTTTPPTDGQALAFDNSSSLWKPKTISGGSGFTLIERYVADGTVGTKTFNISGSPSVLKIFTRGRSSAASIEESLLLRFNGDTGANYDWMLVSGFGTSTNASSAAAATSAYLGSAAGNSAAAGLIGGVESTISGVSNTLFHKNITSQGFSKQNNAVGDFRLRLSGASWRNTAAINSLTIFLGAGNFLTGSVIEVWGGG